MYNNLHLQRILRHTKPVVPKLKNSTKLTYLKEAKGYLTLVIPGIVSIDHVHCHSKFITIYHEAYAVDTLKVKIKAVKGRKMSFSRSYHNLLRFVVRWLCHHNTDLRAG